MTDIDISQLRASIDAVDNQMIALLRERCGYVKQVGMTKKARQAAGRSFIRSGREASMVRRLFAEFSASGDFPPQAAAHLWRIIIAASLSLESALTVSAFASDARQDVYWLAREYFGNFTPISKQGSARRVIADVADDKAEVGALPMPDSTTEDSWWLKLPEDVNIFACVPFIIAGDAPPSVVLIARTAPEPTGDDITLIAIETEQDVSQSRLKAIFDRHQVQVNWLAVENFSSSHRAHLIEMKGFYALQDDVLQNIRRELDSSLIALRHLGGYATPIRYQA